MFARSVSELAEHLRTCGKRRFTQRRARSHSVPNTRLGSAKYLDSPGHDPRRWPRLPQSSTSPPIQRSAEESPHTATSADGGVSAGNSEICETGKSISPVR